MRSIEEAKKWWSVFQRQKSISDLRRYVETTSESGVLIEGGRSAIWKSFLLFDDVDILKWPVKLGRTRQAFVDLRQRFLGPLERPVQNEIAIDPLSDDSNSPWEALRKDELIREEINQDVERCLPENQYFRQPATQALLLDILFVWTKLNPDIGYRQGMHELLAPILWVVEKDAVDLDIVKHDLSTNDPAIGMLITFDASYIGHDTFSIFTKVMQQAKASYEIQDLPHANQTGTADRTIKSRDAAITEKSREIMEDYLGLIDPPLEGHLRKIGIVPQIFLIRWIRLLFIREFPFTSLLQLWDRLIAEGISSRCVDLVCVSMLLRIRWQLLESDANEALQLLLHFPDLPIDQGSSSLVEDAIFLRTRLNSDGGYQIIARRTDRPPAMSSSPSTPRRRQVRLEGFSPGYKASAVLPKRLIDRATSFEGLLNEAARGINARGEKWGVYQAVRGAAEEVRKNVSTIQSKTHSRMPSRNDSGGLATPQSREELAAKLDEFHARNKSLARMLEEATSELWEQQKESTTKHSVDDTHMQAFTKAIAKVQLVQIYLEDPSLTIPEYEVGPAASNSNLARGVSESFQKENNTPVNQVAAETNLQVESEPPKELEATPSANQAGQSATAELPQAVLKRPLLEQSSFSWMLGQEPEANTTRASMFSTTRANRDSNKTRAHRGSAAYLFGEENTGEP